MARQVREPIAIIGSGCRFPGDATSPSKLWKLLREAPDVSKDIDRFAARGFWNKDGHHHGASNVQAAYLLSEDPKGFDAQFFNIQAGEAEAIDPQQRLLLETVYESVEGAGLALEDLRGSDTAVFVGIMCDDYASILYHDSQAIPTYAASGLARSILSNRVSFVFDWRGPSMTIDTACSSSLYALHQAVQVLRDGTSRIAVAAGANLIFSPNNFIAESNLNMLSATGKSQMWDKDANGYARGEGLGAVILKPLSAAIADGDHIECIIRETGLNQDGHTPGLTFPSSDAQTRLIQDTYSRAGLDLRNPADRPQFFEAHGTGTQAGDVVESSAIHKAFFPSEGDCELFDSLLVGSIKTIIGHTEGTAGIAGVLKASLAVQNKIVPPNLHFKTLNPAIKEFYGALKIPITEQPWPNLPPGGVRRVSVNSFGFGGANAHAIIEAYEPDAEEKPLVLPTPAVNALPLELSASSEKSLVNLIKIYLELLHDDISLDLSNLAWTLHNNRSALPYRAFAPAHSLESAVQNLQKQLDDKAAGESNVFTRGSSQEKVLLGVFTGQGAQWPAMGRELIIASKFVAGLVDGLELALNQLPAADRPSWSLKEQMLAAPEHSRITEAELSQPLCTVVQIIIVELLRAAGISFNAVVGHSSGEIGAAYAAGFLTADDAVIIAYYRGRHAHLSSGPQGQKGAMLAVGTTVEDAQELCDLPAFRGRVKVAACNSSSSVTLSGNLDSMKRIEIVLNDEKKFNRMLKVDTAYHSHHMDPCSSVYQKSLKARNIRIQTPSSSCRWYSSVYHGKLMESCEELKHEYWVKNMLQPVLFSQAVKSVFKDEECSKPTMAIEVGPHPSLKGPASSIIEEELNTSVSYVGTATRGVNDVDALSATLGRLWSIFGRSAVNMRTYNKLFCTTDLVTMTTLPSYPFNHERTFWFESRDSRFHRLHSRPPHPLLGAKLSQSNELEHRWRNYLSPTEIPWFDGHKIQGQTLFPAAGFLVMAIEAACQAFGSAGTIQIIELMDSRIHRALGFYTDNGVETLFTLSNVSTKKTGEKTEELSANFVCDACLNRDSGSFLLMASGKIRVSMGAPSTKLLMDQPEDDKDMKPVPIDLFYKSLAQLGYNYSDLFRGITSLKRKTNSAAGEIAIAKTDSQTEIAFPYLLHPAALDVAFQAIFAATSYPGDGALWTLHIPTVIRHVTINPTNCLSGGGVDETLSFFAGCHISDDGAISGDVDLFTADSSSAVCQIEGLEVTPLSPPTDKDDRQMFAETHHFFASPDAEAVFSPLALTSQDKEDALQLDRFTLYHLRTVMGKLEYPEVQDWAQRVLDATASGQHPTCKAVWLNDTWEDVEFAADSISNESIFNGDLNRTKQMIKILGDKPSIPITHASLLREFYESSFGAVDSKVHLALIAQQLVRRFPQLRILELNACSGSATENILKYIEGSFSTYTCTDSSDAELTTIQEKYNNLGVKFQTKVLDISLDAEKQGFTPGSYGVIIVANGFHNAKDPVLALRNARSLLKPGGYLIALQVTNTQSLRVGLTIRALAAANQFHDLNVSQADMCPPLDVWDSQLRSVGFSGIDTATPDADLPFTVFVSQAVDPQINSLRSPLESNARIENLLLIGGKQFAITRMVENIRKLLQPFCDNIVTIKSIDELEISTLASRPMVLSLTELDTPFFKGLSSPKLRALQRILDRCKLMLWIVSGANGSNPYANMMRGVLRCLVVESPHLFTQTLNIEAQMKQHPNIIAETLLRMQLVESWQSNYEPIWTKERELMSDGSKLWVSRYLPNHSLDEGYNTMRRTVLSEALPQEKIVALVKDSSVYALQQFRLPRSISHQSTGQLITITVRHSIVSSLRVKDFGYFYLHCGVDLKSNIKYLVLSEECQSILIVAPSRLLPVNVSDDDESNLLLSVAYILVANAILEDSAPNSSLIVHEPPSSLATFITKMASKKSISARFTTTKQDEHLSGLWKYVHPRTQNRNIDSLIPDNISAFIVCAEDEISPRLSARLPFGVYPSYINKFLGSQSVAFPALNGEGLLQVLLESYLQYSEERLSVFSTDDLLLLRDVPKEHFPAKTVRLLDWTDKSPVPAKVTSAMDEVSFSDKKTYFLVGMTGDLGRSTCVYMMTRGARFFALGSRNPCISSEWLEMARVKFGATVRTFSLDIANRESLHTAYKTICETMPPIGGVANASLVIRDGLFANMECDKVQQALDPKVTGSLLLDELFYEIDLDFFILFSSLTFITGNPGQSVYCAGNAFIIALGQRRRQRGLNASVMNLAGISGIGFITRNDHSILTRLDIQGYGVMSERDYLYFWAEAVIAGRADSGRDPVLSCGLRYTDPLKDEGAPRWATEPPFAHYRLERTIGESEAKTGDVSDWMHTALLEAETEKDACAIILDALLRMLHKKLRMAPEDSVDSNVAIVEMGVDSLVAVEMRSWFVHELELDIPAIKILGGATLTNLAEDAAERIAQEKVPKIVRVSTESTSPEPLAAGFSDSVSQAGSQRSGSDTKESSSTLDEGDEIAYDESKEIGTVVLNPRPTFERTEKMSYASVRYWNLRQHLEDDSCMNIVFRMRMAGKLNIEKCQQMARDFGQRHEAFRTAFFQDEDEGLMQGVMPESLFRLEASMVESEAEATELTNALVHHKFDLERGEVVRILLLSLSEFDHIMVLCGHHIAIDGFSVTVIVAEIDLLFRDQAMPPIQRQFLDFAVQQRLAVEQGQMGKEINFWRNMFPDFPEPLPLFPLDRVGSRVPLLQYEHEDSLVKLDQSTANNIRARCRENRCTTFHFFLATLQTFLFLSLNTKDFCIGIAEANRKDSKTFSTVGCLVNLLPLRFKAPAKKALFKNVLAAAKQIFHQSLQHSSLPFDVLLQELDVPQNTSYHPLFQVYLNYRQFAVENFSMLECKAEGEQIEPGTAYDLVLSVIDVAGGDVKISMQAQKSLYTESHAHTMLRSYMKLVHFFADDFSSEIGGVQSVL